MKLKLKISPSEKIFKEKIGNEEWDKIEQTIRVSNNHTCQGCGYKLRNDNEKPLQVHLIEENLENIINSEFTLLCFACHITQHIDVAIDNNWVRIVNSKFTQEQLVDICRNSFLLQNLKNGNIVPLNKKTPEQFLYELKSRSLSPNNKIKIIFKNNFPWGNI